MNRFPLCIDLQGKLVCLVGDGEQIRQKAEKLAPFGAVLIRCDGFTEREAMDSPALVIVGDTEIGEAVRISELCRRHRIPVNVVDVPSLCSFHFPSLITRGDLTVSVSTGGTSPAAAAYLRTRIEAMLPDSTEEILDWICAHRAELRARGILKAAIAAAFSQNRPLTGEELSRLEEKPV